MEFYSLEHDEKNFNRKAIIFIHGANHGAWCWNMHFMKFFYLKGFDVYSLNLYNRGMSSYIEKICLDDFVKQVEEFIKNINKKILIISHSVGTAIVQKCIIERNIKCAKCVLIAPVAPWGMRYDLIFSPRIRTGRLR